MKLNIVLCSARGTPSCIVLVAGKNKNHFHEDFILNSARKLTFLFEITLREV